MVATSGIHQSPEPPLLGDVPILYRRIAMASKMTRKLGTFFIVVLFAVALAALAGAIQSKYSSNGGTKLLLVGGALIKSSKIFYCCFFHLGSLGVCVDKMDPNFHKKMTRSAPLGVLTMIYPRFVSDWTGDSHLTHYLPSKTMDFWF